MRRDDNRFYRRRPQMPGNIRPVRSRPLPLDRRQLRRADPHDPQPRGHADALPRCGRLHGLALGRGDADLDDVLLAVGGGLPALDPRHGPIMAVFYPSCQVEYLNSCYGLIRAMLGIRQQGRSIVVETGRNPTGGCNRRQGRSPTHKVRETRHPETSTSCAGEPGRSP